MLQVRLARDKQSAWRENSTVCWPIRYRLFADLWGAKPARRGGRQPTPGGKRSAQPLLDVKDATKKGQCPLGLQQPAFGKTQDVATSDDQVIQHSHVHQRQCRLQCLREHLVGARRLGRTARMVMHQQ